MSKVETWKTLNGHMKTTRVTKKSTKQWAKLAQSETCECEGWKEPHKDTAKEILLGKIY